MSSFLDICLLIISIQHVCSSIVLKPGIAVKIKNLKPEGRNNSHVKQRARMMSYSFGFIMDPPIQINSKNAREVRVRWMGNESITLGINPKYLCRIPKIVIHDIPVYQDTIIDSDALVQSLEKDPNKVVVFPIAPWSAECVRHIHPQLHDSICDDELIVFDIMMDWVDLVLTNSSKNLHFINEESGEKQFFTLPYLINVSQYLPIPFASKLLSKNTVSHKNWIKQHVPTKYPTASPTKSQWDVVNLGTSGLFETVVLNQVHWLSKDLNTARSRTKGRSTFVIHKALATPKKHRRLIQTLSSDPEKIVLVWPGKGNQWRLDGSHKNVFYQRSHSECLSNKKFLRSLRCLDNSGVLTIDQFAKMLIFLFSFIPEDTMGRAMQSMHVIYFDTPGLHKRLHRMNKIGNHSELESVKRVFIGRVTDHEGIDQDIDFKSDINLCFWAKFGREIKRAVLEISLIQTHDDIENVAVCEAILYWACIQSDFNGSYSLHIISSNDQVWCKHNVESLGPYWMTDALRAAAIKRV